MSIATIESPATVRAQARATRYEDALAAAERNLAADFMAAARVGNMNAVATFAPRTTDWTLRNATGENATRPQLVGEVLLDSIEATPMADHVMGLLCAVARGEDQQTMAQLLLTNMAHAWAAQNAMVDA